ncbi:hypothetical protein IWZ03DRAFT_122300 [Phyllosticta citriasiana]|uniref:Secreted protein n=1 Tax=Phyllosticta citriasiana TaxID=595635 RepID=A0ABR1K8A4_9PEZI
MPRPICRHRLLASVTERLPARNVVPFFFFFFFPSWAPTTLRSGQVCFTSAALFSTSFQHSNFCFVQTPNTSTNDSRFQWVDRLVSAVLLLTDISPQKPSLANNVHTWGPQPRRLRCRGTTKQRTQRQGPDTPLRPAGSALLDPEHPKIFKWNPFCIMP